MARSDDKILLFLKKNPIGVACTVITIGLLVFSYFRVDAMTEAEDQLQQKSSQAERLAQNIVNSAQLKEQLTELREAQDKINTRLIQESALAANLQYFYRVENEAGVKLIELTQGKDVKPIKAKPFSFYSIPYAVSVEGEYPKVLAFLRALENGNHYCRVNSINLNAGQGESSSFVIMTLRLDLLGQL